MNQNEEPSFFLAWAIWSSFLAGLALLLLVAYFQQGTLSAMVLSEFSIVGLRTLGYGIAIVLFPIIGGIKRRIDRQYSTMLRNTRGGSPDTDLSGRYLAGLTLAFALAETIGIVGFLLFLSGDDLNTLYIFVGLSALAMILHRPRADFPH